MKSAHSSVWRACQWFGRIEPAAPSTRKRNRPTSPTMSPPRVYRLNPDGRLNMRAANNPESEVMMQLAPNAELNLIGMDKTDEWALVDYAADTGEIISGWVSAAYIQLLLNGEPVRPQHAARARRNGCAHNRRRHPRQHSARWRHWSNTRATIRRYDERHYGRGRS